MSESICPHCGATLYGLVSSCYKCGGRVDVREKAECEMEISRQKQLKPKVHFVTWVLVILVILGVLWASVYTYIDYSRKRNDPCRYETNTDLAIRFPQLQELWNRQVYELKVLQAMNEIQSAATELSVKEGSVTPGAALQVAFENTRRVFEMAERHSGQFQSLCKRLVQQSSGKKD